MSKIKKLAPTETYARVDDASRNVGGHRTRPVVDVKFKDRAVKIEDMIDADGKPFLCRRIQGSGEKVRGPAPAA